MRPVFAASALAFLLTASPVFASAYPQADKYFEVRDRAQQVVESFTLEEVQTQATKFAGKLLEIRGAITGVFDSSTQGSMIIQPASGPSITLVLPAGKRLTEWPLLDVGNSVRLLCRVVPTAEGSPSGNLEVVMPVKEYEAARIDEARAKAALAKKQEAEKRAAVQRRQKPDPRLASRGVSGATVQQAQQRYTQAQLVDIYGQAVRYFNRRLSVSDSKQIAALILNYSNRYGLDARLVMAVIACESNFNPNAVSPVGAMGLGQLMPGTAADLGVGNAWDPSANLEGSTRLLKNHIKNMSRGGRPSKEAIKLALACYNAGAGAVKKYKGIPPYRETQNYVKKIIRLYWSMLPPSERTWNPD